jgi:diguanylate cyclase (GGDEF)-like protein
MGQNGNINQSISFKKRTLLMPGLTLLVWTAQLILNQRLGVCLAALNTQTERALEELTGQMGQLLLAQRLLHILLLLLLLGTLYAVFGPVLRARRSAARGEKEGAGTQLAFAASHDKLTGLFNRTGFDYALEQEDLSVCALLMADVDQFGEIVDDYGQEMGDRMLLWVGQVLRGSFRAQDQVCRIDTSRFAVLMHDVSPQHAQLIRKKVAAMNRTLSSPEDDRPPVSISVGAAFGQEEPSSLMTRSERALNRVKESGGGDCAISR